MIRQTMISLSMLLWLFAGMTCTDSPAQIAEEEQVKDVVLRQLQAIAEGNYAGEANVWAHTNYIVRKDVTGWDSISVFYKEAFSDQDRPKILHYTASNYSIHMNGTFASVFHDEQVEYIQNGERKSMKSRGAHKFLEKIDGTWKIIALF